MSGYLSLAPIIERTARDNALAGPALPEAGVPTPRTRSVAARVLRRTAEIQLRLAARLERTPARHLATT
ncbi:hypothetical protein [Propionicimonas sp.]|uniref:hypothetical protein n=1 Tax=Propionicimonas sp. TaxID=1955623 RepID=UPI0039E547E1